jgi:hypothetical protein
LLEETERERSRRIGGREIYLETRTGNETREEGLAAQVLIMLLEVLLGGGDELDADELEATVLEARDNWADESTLCLVSSFLSIEAVKRARISISTSRIQLLILT